MSSSPRLRPNSQRTTFRPVSPRMQQEMSEIVYKQKQRARFANKDTEDHFATGEMNIAAEKDATVDATELERIKAREISFESVYGTAHEGKDTMDHFSGYGMSLEHGSDYTTRIHVGKQGRSMESINDRAETFDIVYSSTHEGKDTADHFGVGMNVGGPESALPLDARHDLDLATKAAQAAKMRAKVIEHADEPIAEATHMGHEQKEGRGDTSDHFKGFSLALDASADPQKHHHHAYASRHSLDHFGNGMDVKDDERFSGQKVEAEEHVNDNSFGRALQETSHVDKHDPAYTLKPTTKSPRASPSPRLKPLRSTTSYSPRAVHSERNMDAIMSAGSPSGYSFRRQSLRGVDKLPGNLQLSARPMLMHARIRSDAVGAVRQVSTGAGQLRATPIVNQHGLGMLKPTWWG